MLRKLDTLRKKDKDIMLHLEESNKDKLDPMEVKLEFL